MKDMVKTFRIFALLALAAPWVVFAQTATSTAPPTISLNAETLAARATASVSPSAQTVIAGSTFNVSIYLNTEGNSANTLNFTVEFPPDKLQIVNPSVGGVSLIQVWLQPPIYSNTDGDAEFVGVIPNGIVTAGGLVTTITFKAIAAGTADVMITPDSSVLANDGLGTPMNTEFDRGIYTIVPQPPAGPVVFSPTHPFPSNWYNNNDPTIDWQESTGTTEFSYVLDSDPSTVPGDNASTTTGTTVSYDNVGDGLWYFHIKALSDGAWGATTNFPIQIDTMPPAAFTPAADIIANGTSTKVLISFFTTDALSGIDHYEVAVVDDNASAPAAPVFTQTQSPYEFVAPGPGSYHVIVRAFDPAGNVREGTLDVTISTPLVQFLKAHDAVIIIYLLLFIILLFLLHYFFGHKLLRRAHRILVAIEEENRAEKVHEAEEIVKGETGGTQTDKLS
jgi:hypothetical protein